MKTSEFIREAVDKYLAHDVPYPCNTGASAELDVYLCHCLISLDSDTNWKYRKQAHKAFEAIRQFVYLERISAGYSPQEPWSTFPNFAECTKNQEIRFMFAEFLALMFEDEGD